MYIERFLEKKIERYLDMPEMIAVFGPRQVGKTTLLFHLKENLERKGEKVIYFNLDRYDDLTYFSTQKELLNKIRFEIGDKGYVFIDEVQRLKEAGRFLKGLYDYRPPYKFIVTGSGSLELKAKI